MKRKDTEIILSLVFIMGSMIFLNLILRKLVFRVDLTEDRIYTLSGSTKNVLSKLDDIVTIKAYFSKKLPPNLVPVKRQVEDILEEYRIYSKGKLRFEFIDPAENKEIETKVTRMGIPKVQMNIFEKDKLQVIGGFLGMGIFYKDKKELIPVIETPENLEYEITSRILKLTKREEVKIGVMFLSKDKKDNYTIFKDELSKHYSVREVSPNFIPDDINLLLVLGWKELDPKALYNIDQHIMRGKSSIFLIDAVNVNDELRARALKEKDMEFFKAYGIKVNTSLVQDVSHESAPFAQGGMAFLIPYPYWVKAVNKFLNRENPIVNKLEDIVFPWPSSLDTIADVLKNQKVVILVKTTPKAWETKNFSNLMPNPFFKPPEERKQFNLAVLISGSFESYFSDRELPQGVDTTKFIKACEQLNQVAFVSNLKFIDDRFLQMYPENILFLLNLSDALGFGRELIEIRSRGKTERPLKQISDWQKGLFKWGNTFGMALIIIILGILRFTYRQKRKMRRE